MERIKIRDLAKDVKISKEEMMKVFGGGSTLPLPDFWKPHDDKASSFGPDDPSFKKRFPNTP